MGDLERQQATQAPQHDASKTWAERFPHLHDSLTVDGQSFADTRPAQDAANDSLVDVVVSVVVEKFPAERFDQLFPSAPRSMPKQSLRANARSLTCLSRLTESATLEGVLSKSVSDVFDVRGVGTGTVFDIVRSLVLVSLNGWAEPSGPQQSDEEKSLKLPPAIQQLLDDVAALSRWRRVRGQSNETLFEVRSDDTAPEPVQEIIARLEAFDAADFPGAPEPTASETLATFHGSLEEREQDIFRNRIIEPDPCTLQAVADRWNVTRERIRQLEARLQSNLDELRRFGTPVGDLVAALRAEIAPVASLERLLSTHPELTEDVPDVGFPLWQVLDGIDDSIKVTDGWAAAPDTTVARTNTRAFLDAFADEHGVVDLKMLPRNSFGEESESRRWLEWCGYEFYRDHVLTNSGNLGDHAAGILSVEGESMSVEDIFSAIGKDRSMRSFLNQLSSDPRFTRISKTEWALSGWDVEAYGSIRSQIARVLDENGGTIDIDELVDAISTRFGVAESSVRAYAASGDFLLERGEVSRRTVAAAPRKAPEATRYLYKQGSVWRYAITVNKDHLRGSGFTVPSGLARLMGVDFGSTVELHSRLGSQAIRWKAIQPGCSSIRRFLEELQSAEGDRVFLEFRDDSAFDVVPSRTMPSDAPPLVTALAMTGHPNAEALPDFEVVAGLAEALGVSGEDRARRILSAARGRDEEAIIGLMEQAWVSNSM